MKWVLAWFVVGIAVQLIQYMRTTQSVGYRAYHAAMTAAGIKWWHHAAGVLGWPIGVCLMLSPGTARAWTGEEKAAQMETAVNRTHKTFCPRCDRPWLTHRGQMCPPAQK